MIRTDHECSTSPRHCSYAVERSEAWAHSPGSRDRPLDALRGSSVADRFRVWTGRSGRRYIFSVFALDEADDDVDRSLLMSEAVVIAVARRPDGARAMLWVGLSGPSPASVFAGHRVRALARRGGCELHLHLLASDDDERLAIVRDFDGC